MKHLKMVALASLLAKLLVGQSAPAAGLDGEWNGSIAGKLRVILRVDKPSADGSYKAVLESIDQGNAKIPVNAVTKTEAGSYRFDMQLIHATFDGRLLNDGSELDGIFEQGGARIPLVLRHAGSAPAQPKSVTIGSIHFDSCTASDGATQALCGTYDVWENRASKQGRKIALNIVILPAQTAKPEPDPVFGLAGGPGESATSSFPMASFARPVRQQRDVVLIDQRGAGKSNPLPCNADSQGVQDLLNDPYPDAMLSTCRAELEKKADLTQYTTANAIDDFDEVRAALGYSKINVLGGSYGSLASLVYLRRHPEHIRTVTIEAVAPPDYRLPLLFAKTIQSALDHLFADCAADDTCKKDYPKLKEEFEATIARLDKQPAKFDFRAKSSDQPISVTISRGAFVNNLRTLLYQPAIVAQLPYILHRAAQNDWNPYAGVVVALARAMGGVVARGMAYSVTCAESLPFITESDIKNETAGTYLGDFDIRRYQRKCAAWPHATVSKEVLAPVQSDIPALLIAGAEDPATPSYLAEKAARTLTHSKVVDIPNGTHLTSAQCTDEMIATFIRSGSEKNVDTSCVAKIQKLPFVSEEKIKQLRALTGQ